METFIRAIASTIKVEWAELNKLKDVAKTIKYLESIDYTSMPEAIKEMNLKLLEESKKLQNTTDKKYVLAYQENCDEEAYKYVETFADLDNLILDKQIMDSYNTILNAGLELVEDVTVRIGQLYEEAENEYSKSYDRLITHIEKQIRKEFFGEDIKAVVVEEKKPEAKKEIFYQIKKSSKSINEIRQILVDFLAKNEAMFNRIIFEGKGITMSITERILRVEFKPGIGYVVNFISEPDTNYGKFYQNLLKVLQEAKEKIYLEHDLLIVPEEGKGLVYLNSFYQNYLFIREKLDSILLKYKLQNSLLNQSFTITHLIFDKSSGKYLVFYNGNVVLAKGCDNYLTNQAKLGQTTFELEFIEQTAPISQMIQDRYNTMLNRVDLIDTNIGLKVQNFSKPEQNLTSAALEISGIKLLIDPTVESCLDFTPDILILTSSHLENLDIIAKLMVKYPELKMFTSDITYKIARICWLNSLNTGNFQTGSEESQFGFNRKDLDLINDRIIKITPEGKGYNFRNLVNIKFYNGGILPGSAIVELRDAKNKIIYLGNFNTENDILIKGSDIEINSYDYAICRTDCDLNTKPQPLPLDKIREKLAENKQVFIFTDTANQLQHVTYELAKADLSSAVYAGDATFSLLNKEIAKLINFGSSWGDYFVDKNEFVNSTSHLNPFVDEYEFYKKFSSDDALIFVLPFKKEDLEMVIKSKITADNMLIISSEYSGRFNEIMQSYLEIVPIASLESFTPETYNYTTLFSKNNLQHILSNPGNLKKLISLNSHDRCSFVGGEVKNKISYYSETAAQVY